MPAGPTTAFCLRTVGSEPGLPKLEIFKSLELLPRVSTPLCSVLQAHSPRGAPVLRWMRCFTVLERAVVVVSLENKA